MRDVAALAGVSTATVSRVLNNMPVDPTMTERVRAAAAELGYRTNSVARNLRRQRADVWALIISDIGNPFFTSVARGVEDVAQREGYSIVLCNSDEDATKEAQYLDVAEREQVSGVILSPNVAGSDISRLTAANIPVVAVDRSMRGPVDSVLVLSRDGARNATLHLLDEGWNRPACVTGPAQADTAEQRLAGYLDALRERHIRSAQTLIRHTDYRADTARAAVAGLLNQRNPPDALFVANSSMALGALEELAHRGLRAGVDIGLIAFDDAPWAPFVNPPMSVVAQPAYELGVRAGELLLDRIAKKAPPEPRTELLSTSLIVRDSSRRRVASALQVQA
jgi:LacI family transcriptional regulator